MRQLSVEEIEQILDTTTVAELTINDLRILVGALNALEYFGAAQGEDYIDADGLELRARLEKRYTTLVEDKVFRARIRQQASNAGEFCRA